MIIIIYNSRIPQKGALIHVSIGESRSASADVHIERSLVPGEYGLALIDKGSHRLLMVRRSRRADHVCRFLAHRIQKVGGQGMVKIILHAGVSLRGTLG